MFAPQGHLFYRQAWDGSNIDCMALDEHQLKINISNNGGFSQKVQN
jgi:hypothetical protein